MGLSCLQKVLCGVFNVITLSQVYKNILKLTF